MAITFVGDAFTVDANGGAVAATPPTGSPTTGDVALVVCTSYDSVLSDWSNAGWTSLVRYAANQALDWTQEIFFKVIAGGESYTFTNDEAQYSAVYTSAWRGVDNAAPVDTVNFSTNVGTTLTATGTGVTVGNDNSILVWIMQGYNQGLASGPATFDAREVNYDSVNNIYSLGVNTGATGNKTATMNASAEWSVAMLVLKEAAGGGGGVVAPVDHSSVMSFPALCRKPANDNGNWIRGRGGLWERKAA